MRVLAALLAVAAVPSVAVASTTIATGAGRPGLRVDSMGNAEVAWTAAGTRHTLVVPRSGRVLPGGHLPGADVSRPAAAAVPFASVVRRTPDGRMWALQRWSVSGRGAADLRIARWHGSPTKLTLQVANDVLTGVASYHDAPLPLYSKTFAGTRMTVYVYIDGWSGGRWQRLGAVRPQSDGTFQRSIPSSFSTAPKFRAVVVGPVINNDIVPDAAAIATR